HEDLRAPAEEILQRSASLVGVEAVLLVDLDPRQLLPPLRQLVALARVLLLRLQQLEPLGEPLFPRPGLVHCHRSASFVRHSLSAELRALGVTSVAGFRAATEAA